VLLRGAMNPGMGLHNKPRSGGRFSPTDFSPAHHQIDSPKPAFHKYQSGKSPYKKITDLKFPFVNTPLLVTNNP